MTKLWWKIGQCEVLRRRLGSRNHLGSLQRCIRDVSALSAATLLMTPWLSVRVCLFSLPWRSPRALRTFPQLGFNQQSSRGFHQGVTSLGSGELFWLILQIAIAYKQWITGIYAQRWRDILWSRMMYVCLTDFDAFSDGVLEGLPPDNVDSVWLEEFAGISVSCDKNWRPTAHRTVYRCVLQGPPRAQRP